MSTRPSVKSNRNSNLAKATETKQESGLYCYRLCSNEIAVRFSARQHTFRARYICYRPSACPK